MKKILLLSICVCFLTGCTSNTNTSKITSNQSISNDTPTISEEGKEKIKVLTGPFSNLTIVGIEVFNEKITISGNTDLPNGSSLNVGFDVWGRLASDPYIGVKKKITVANNNFQVVLAIPQRDEFKKGAYEISVLFTPRGQSDEVIQIVGKDGEKLEGELVEENYGFKMLKLIEKRDLQLTINLPSYSFQQPSEFSQGSAERVVANYVSAWKNQNWKEMTNFVQKTWLRDQDNPAELLEAQYGFKKLKSFEITDITKDSNVMSDVTFVIEYEFIANKISKKQIKARVIKETSSYTLSKQGQWGVNPISTLKEVDAN